jgi:hypothetical protein
MADLIGRLPPFLPPDERTVNSRIQRFVIAEDVSR